MHPLLTQEMAEAHRRELIREAEVARMAAPGRGSRGARHDSGARGARVWKGIGRLVWRRRPEQGSAYVPEAR